jgi:hypothetical protein
MLNLQKFKLYTMLIKQYYFVNIYAKLYSTKDIHYQEIEILLTTYNS